MVATFLTTRILARNDMATFIDRRQEICKGRRMPETYDAIVLGLGAMGAASAYQLAKRGARVLGIDQYAPPHRLGSSHGESRITRIACAEGAHYTPFVRRSHEIWQELEAETGRSLLTRNGMLMIGPPGEHRESH